MKYLNTAISHHRSMFCMLLLILLAGLYARSSTTIESSPDVTIPIIWVQVYLDGVSPEDSARLLVRPMEKELRNLEGVDELIANAYESNAVMIIRFNAEEDIDQALVNVREAIDRAKAELPRDAEEPVINEMSADAFAAIVVTLTGDQVGERQLFQAAQKLKRQFENLPGVLNANMVGHREEVVEAIVDPALLEIYQITSADMTNAVLNNNLLVPAGEVDNGKGRFSIKVPGLIENYQDVYQLPLKSTSNGHVLLGDIADIRRTFKDPKRYTSVNGKPAITIEVQKRLGAGSIEISAAVREQVNANLKYLPQGIEVGYVLDQSDYTKKMVNEMQGNILTAMALVMIVVVAALGIRSGILVGLGIPFSLLFAIIITYSIGYTFNFMVMFGMLLALGMLIDGAIVITEFADRKMAEGLSSRDAYMESVKRMFWPVIASTATTLAAFLPVMFWPGVSGEFMRYLPVTVFAVLFGSLFYALLFAPVIGAHFGKNNMSPSVRNYLQHLESDPPTSLAGITGNYARILAWLVQRPLQVILATLAILIAIFLLYGKYNAGVEFFTESETKYGSATVRAQGNLSAQEIRDLVREVEQRILEVKGVNTLYTASGSDSSDSSKAKDQIGSIWIELNDPATLARSTHEVYAEIRQHTADMPGIIVNAKGFEDGPPVGKPIQIQLQGLNRDKLLSTAQFIRQHLSTVAGLRDITDTTPLPGIEWEMQVNRSLAAQLGVNVLEVGRAVQLVTNGVKVGEYRPDDADEEVDIRVRYPLSNRGINVLDQLRINTNDGVIPISDFVQRVAKPKVDTIKRINGIEVVTVKADVDLGVLADDKVKEIQQWLAQQTIDPEVSVVFRGANEEQDKSKAFLSVAFSLALFLMFILLVTQFNSFYQGLLILSAVVMSTAGVLLGLLVTQATFSVILTGIGIVALAGIVVNNNIILIDTYNHLRKAQALSPIDAVIAAGAQRLRPVFLTTATTIMGMLPIALNTSVDLISRTVITGGEISSTWIPLATAIVYGLLFSTLLTLIVTPVMLVLPSYLVKKYHKLKPAVLINT
ncbi:efflux RND transporter permease subunit [Dasania sp. GY-MA-18]|uniref:Efflux RND transporter permease subunit n=1 Tax=Dasania phycosphaerae TaxID=2950436 RepID=A0A9J6RHZ9_9GAMM|nr:MULTISPECIES: efflux RND transporter permease subunit [Dasania]MCR8921411.1 efflux RND transporter permease subunit [Dasania sp. GY-MA-18]MCZ0863839.1 efflux RND transporter permease subunit [Dasania phycosphaerae]MCZ0867567.1 efflux RND transporter permease subunit [Dasania phycosphaerae]